MDNFAALNGMFWKVQFLSNGGFPCFRSECWFNVIVKVSKPQSEEKCTEPVFRNLALKWAIKTFINLWCVLLCHYSFGRFYKKKPQYQAVISSWSTWAPELQDINQSSKSPWHSHQYHSIWWRWAIWCTIYLLITVGPINHLVSCSDLCVYDCFSRFTWWWRWWVASSRNGSQPNQTYLTPLSGTRRMPTDNVFMDYQRQLVSFAPTTKLNKK